MTTAGESTGKGGDEEKGGDTEDLTVETALEVAINNFDKPGALLSDVQERQRSFLKLCVCVHASLRPCVHAPVRSRVRTFACPQRACGRTPVLPSIHESFSLEVPRRRRGR